MTETTYERATREYDEEYESELVDAIATALFEASRVSDCNAAVIRTGEAASALLTVLASILAMSPSAPDVREFAVVEPTVAVERDIDVVHALPSVPPPRADRRMKSCISWLLSPAATLRRSRLPRSSTVLRMAVGERAGDLEDDFPPAGGTLLSPNRGDISRHLYALFPPEFVTPYPDAWIEIAIATKDTDWKPKAAEHFSPFNLPKAIDYAEKQNRAGHNVYVGPSLRQGTTGPSGRSEDANFLASIHAWADLDGDFYRVSNILKANTLKNAMLVMTGTVPDKRAHPYFRFGGVVTEAAQQKAANVALKTLLGTDDVEDPCRLMRLAGTVSYPPPPKAACGYIPELVTLHIRKDAPATTVEHLTGLAGIGTATAGLGKTDVFGFDFNGASKQGRDDDELVTLLETSRIARKWHNSIRDAIATMIGRGWSDSAIRLACAQYCKGGANDPDLDPLIDGGRKKWDKPSEEQAPPGAGDRNGDPDNDEFGPAPAGSPPPPSLQWLDMSNWDHEKIPERQWAIRDRVPLNQVGLFSGEGGTGKSIVELMKNVAHVMARDWFGSLPEQGGAFYIGAEDDVDEIHIRLATIAKHYGVTFTELVKNGLHVLPLLGQDAVLCASTRGGHIETTALYRQIYQQAGDLKPKNISVDTLSRAFAGDEINRVQVYAFAMHMQALAKVASGAVTVLSHPSLAGMASGSGISGSTAWHGAFRFRQYLKGVNETDKDENGKPPDTDFRELQFKKNQYGPLAQPITIKYDNGIFRPVSGASSLEKLAREARADSVFMDLLRRFAGQGQNVSSKKASNNYAPTLFAEEPEAKKHGLRKSDFVETMRRLFAADKIMVKTYGRPAQLSSRLVEKGREPE